MNSANAKGRFVALLKEQMDGVGMKKLKVVQDRMPRVATLLLVVFRALNSASASIDSFISLDEDCYFQFSLSASWVEYHFEADPVHL